MKEHIEALQSAIDNTLEAIHEGRAQVEEIAHSTLDEVKRLEQEYEAVRTDCSAAIVRVEEYEREVRASRERLMVVNRDIHKFTEADMRLAYDNAQQAQTNLGQWRERETQLRLRRDDIARQLKALKATAHQAEVVALKFSHATSYLATQFGDISSVLQDAQTQALLGLRVLQVQEDERRQLATQLHDGPMQSLASVAMRVQAFPSNEHDGYAFQQDIRLRLNHVISDLRQMVFDLRPPLLDDLGLVPTLKRYIQQWTETTGVSARVQLVGLEAALAPTEKITVFRNVQECLANIQAHSQATAVDVTLRYGTDSLVVEIVDNGVGMTPEKWAIWLQEGKLGLALCKERLGLLGGAMVVDGMEHDGVRVAMTLPITRRNP